MHRDRNAFCWIDKAELHDFESVFDKFANQECPILLKTELQRNIGLALHELSKFRPLDQKYLIAAKYEPEIPIPESSGYKCELQRHQEPKRADLDEPCTVCRSNADEENSLLCDGCDLCVHTYCIGLLGIPEGTWNCPWCCKHCTFDSKEVRPILPVNNYSESMNDVTRICRDESCWRILKNSCFQETDQMKLHVSMSRHQVRSRELEKTGPKDRISSLDPF